MKPTGATKETMGEPTPRPWRAVALLPDGLEHHIIAGEFREGSAIASADNPNGLVAYADMPANVQLIVTAVNERERLRAAIDDAIDKLERASLVQDHSVHIVKQACRFVAKNLRVALNEVDGVRK